MSDTTAPGASRRSFLLGAAGVGASLVVGARVIAPSPARGAGLPAAAPAASPARVTRKLHLVGTDGWAAMPASAPADLPFFPDPLAPPGFNTYTFGFRDVTGMSPTQVASQRGKAQISAPTLVFNEEEDITITLSNLGLVLRPDLFDGHTLHWHGFVNAIPLFDGVPELSLAVPIGRDLDYFYRPHDAGTYMYHCHFEDVEHVQMGMTGMLWVKPKQNLAPVGADQPGTKYAYNDGDGSTKYDREFGFLLTELWSAAHYRDAHIQVSDWTDYDPSFWLMNGRAYPDTLAPNGDPTSTAAGRLQYQPNSSLVTCNAGERVLLRMSNLGYQSHTMTADNIDMTVVAKDGSLLRGRDGTANYLSTTSVDIGPGESRDVIFQAPTAGEYLLYDRRYSYLNNGGGGGYGGIMTRIRVGDPGTYPAQTSPNA